MSLPAGLCSGTTLRLIHREAQASAQPQYTVPGPMVGLRVASALLLCGVIAAASTAEDWEGWAVRTRKLQTMAYSPSPSTSKCKDKPNTCCALPSWFNQIPNPS